MATLFKRHIELEPTVISEKLNILRSISKRYKYEDGKKTDTVAGYVYEVVNKATYDTFKVLVEGDKKPLMTNDELMAILESGNHVVVEFDNARIRPYYSNLTKQIEDSIKADGVHIVETE